MSIINLQDKNLYFIGGIVRDKILGKESFDVDVTYVGNAIEFAKTIPNAEILQVNEPFGTVRIKLNGQEIDIASTRSESYPQKGHLPIVQNIGCPLKEDVLRRDFTINAMAKSTLTGEIIDYTNGLNDIKTKTLRILHGKSFIDDPTRIVRGLKFSVRFGFKLDKHTKKLQDEYLNNINYDLSYKRLKKELEETFNLNSVEAFEQFIEQKIYKLISPENKDLKFDKKRISTIRELINKYKPKNIWIIYVGLIPYISTLPLTKIEKKIVEDYKDLNGKSFKTNYEIYKNFENLPIESIIMFSINNSKPTLKYLNILKNIKISINGKDLQNIGISPSPKYQQCFDFILQEKLKNPALTKEQEIKLAKIFFEN